MIRILLLVILLLYHTLSIAGLVSSNAERSTRIDGVLAITMQSAPASGLAIPKVVVLRGFIGVYYNYVNWGDTWNLIVPSGNYRIISLPVSGGSDIYVSTPLLVYVPPGGSVNPLITYHVI